MSLGNIIYDWVRHISLNFWFQLGVEHGCGLPMSSGIPEILPCLSDVLWPPPPGIIFWCVERMWNQAIKINATSPYNPLRLLVA